jgi:hypothetical protein
MEDTTTSGDNGAAAATAAPAQPDQTTEAVSLGEQGAPVLRPRVAETSPPSQVQTQEAAPAEASAEETQQAPSAPTTDAQADDTSDIQAWAAKKGIDLENADPVKLAQMVRESEKRMHEATAKARELETGMVESSNLEYTGNEAIDQLAIQVNQMNIQNRVRDFFEANPSAREYESKMAELVVARPWLQNDLEALHALAVNSPDRAAELKRDGGREALTNLAQKQSAVPPPANASTGATSSSEKITSANVDELVAKNGQEWFKKNYSAINRAMADTR